MPDMDGVETIKDLHHEFTAVKFIAIGGSGSRGMLDMLPTDRRLGAAEILYKPKRRRGHAMGTNALATY